MLPRSTTLMGARFRQLAAIGREHPDRVNTHEDAEDDLVPARARLAAMEAQHERRDDQPDADQQVQPFLPHLLRGEGAPREKESDRAEDVGVPRRRVAARGVGGHPERREENPCSEDEHDPVLPTLLHIDLLCAMDTRSHATSVPEHSLTWLSFKERRMLAHAHGAARIS